VPNGDDGSGSKSAQFPPRICPQCRGRSVPCDLCGGERVVSRFKAAAWFVAHPEASDPLSSTSSFPPPKPEPGEDPEK